MGRAKALEASLMEQVHDLTEATLTSRIVQQILVSADRGDDGTTACLSHKRDLADQLAVCRSTVKAAYAELEQHGILRRIHDKGAYRCAPPALSRGDAEPPFRRGLAARLASFQA